MNLAINISDKKREYVDNLILYINDIKPFHTKLKNVSEDITCADELKIKAYDTLNVLE